MKYLSHNNEYQSVSRYQILRVIENNKQTYLETYNQILIPETKNDSYHIVSQEEVNRLDIISNNYYKTPTYWWAIALANKLIDPFVIEENTVLRIPSILTLNNISNSILTRR